jgi:hypothetical protein
VAGRFRDTILLPFFGEALILQSSVPIKQALGFPPGICHPMVQTPLWPGCVSAREVSPQAAHSGRAEAVPLFELKLMKTLLLAAHNCLMHAVDTDNTGT